MLIFFLIWSTHCLEQMCLLIVTQVSDVTHGPRVSLSYFNLLVYSWLLYVPYLYSYIDINAFFHFICVINKMISASYCIVVNKKVQAAW